MDVNPEVFGNAYNAERAVSRRDGRPLNDGDIRARVQQLGIRQQRFQRFLADQIEVDNVGLEAMDHLMSTGPDTPTALAQKLEISTAAMSLVIARLEDAGHVTRTRHPTDGRKFVISATDDSVRAAYSHILPMVSDMDALIERTSEQERRVITDFLDGLIQVYDDSIGA